MGATETPRLSVGFPGANCDRDLQLHTFNICVFDCGKCNSTIIKHVYNESADFIGSYAVDFDINGRSNTTDTMQAFGIEGTVSSARLRNTQDYLTPAICRLNKPAAMEHLM